MSGEMHAENLRLQGGQDASLGFHFAMSCRDVIDVVAFGSEVAAGIADGSSVISIPVGKCGILA